MLEWLISPMDPARVHEVGVHISWHARFMVIAWGILIPSGIFIARFFKIGPKQKWPDELDNHFWWNCHRICQYSAALFMLIGLTTVLLRPERSFTYDVHSLLGWTLLAMLMIQIAGGILRGTKGGPTHLNPDGSDYGDHFYMSRRRLLFEIVHKSVGYSALIISIMVILVGLWNSNAPRWMWLMLIGWWSMLLICGAILQRKGYVLDTYMAIWGPDPELPGNRMRAKPLERSRTDQRLNS